MARRQACLCQSRLHRRSDRRGRGSRRHHAARREITRSRARVRNTPYAISRRHRTTPIPVHKVTAPTEASAITVRTARSVHWGLPRVLAYSSRSSGAERKEGGRRCEAAPTALRLKKKGSGGNDVARASLDASI